MDIIIIYTYMGVTFICIILILKYLACHGKGYVSTGTHFLSTFFLSLETRNKLHKLQITRNPDPILSHKLLFDSKISSLICKESVWSGD